MMMAIDYLRTDPSGILIYRRRFPRDLVRHIPSQSPTGKGRTELKVSLKAKSLNEPGAMDRYREAEAEFDAIVEEARRVATCTYDVLDDVLVEFLSKTYCHDLLAEDETMRWRRTPAPATYVTRGAPEEVYDDCREMLEDWDLPGLTAYWRDWACAFARAKGAILDPHDPRMPDLAQALGEAACDVWLAIDRRIDRKRAMTPAAPEAPAIRSAPANEVPESDPTFQAIANEVMGSKLVKIGHSTIEAWTTALRFFQEVHGTPTISRLNRKMVTEWLEILAQKPAKIPKEERGLPLKDLVAIYEGDEEVERVSRKTLRGHLASLATIFTKAQRRGLFDEERTNPFKARPELAGGEPDEASEFSTAEMQAIFDLPVFVEHDRPTQGRGSASYWMPLFLLTTGARPEEAAQLLVSDFEQDEEAGHWWMTITDEGEHPVKGKRSLKTERSGTSGRRSFMVPDLLIRLGLVAYLEDLKAQGEKALFPLLTIKNKKRGHLFPSVSEWWSRYVREHGVVLEGRNRRPYRDFRQAWATAAREGGVPEDAMSYLMGHSNKQGPQTRRYGKRNAHGLRMVDVVYPKLDLSRVKPWQP